MKLKCTFEAVDMGEEIIMVPVGNGAASVHGVLKLNKEGKEIVNMLQEPCTEEQLVNALRAKYENNAETLSLFVHNVVETLRNAELIEE